MKCKYLDPACPCQDGDICHYEGENPFPLSIDRVIAIAKTLRPCFSFAEHYKLKQGFIICYKPNGDLPGKTFSGISWEKVLVSAGWKGYKGHENSL